MLQKLDRNYQYFTGGITIRNQDMLTSAINLKLKVTRKNNETGLSEIYDYQTGKWYRCADITCTMTMF